MRYTDYLTWADLESSQQKRKWRLLDNYPLTPVELNPHGIPKLEEEQELPPIGQLDLL